MRESGITFFAGVVVVCDGVLKRERGNISISDCRTIFAVVFCATLRDIDGIYITALCGRVGRIDGGRGVRRIVRIK